MSRRFIHVPVSGNGAAYIVNHDGINIVKKGKENNGALTTNAVNPLPMKQPEPEVTFGELKSDDLLLLVTDGYADAIGKGGTSYSSFLKKMPTDKAKSLPALFQIFDAYAYQMDDDKTCILIREKEQKR